LYNSKKLMLATTMETELRGLSVLLNTVAKQDLRTQDFSEKQLRTALAELVACFPVYRTYITLQGKPTAEDVTFIEQTIKALREHAVVDSLIIDFLESVLLCRGEDKITPNHLYQRRHFIMKLQQLTGPCMAKGLEDTSFYRFFLLTSLNEVGGDPNHFGITVDQFHEYNQERCKNWPQTMSNSSTHDTKRSEDVRSRINVLSEIPEKWNEAVTAWRSYNEKYKTAVKSIGLVPEPNEEYMIYQTLIGAWPLGATSADDSLVERLKSFLLKSMKEAKLHTSWSQQNKAYEDAVINFLEKILKDSEFIKTLLRIIDETTFVGKLNSLSQLVVKITSPGVPDIYQGQELWDFSLVDPDNRRPVDYSVRQQLLSSVKEAVASVNLNEFTARIFADKDNSGLIKLLATERLLTLRNAHPIIPLWRIQPSVCVRRHSK